MKLLLLAVGQRQPAWAEAAYEEFAKRYPSELRLSLHAVKAEPRQGGKTAEQCMQAEAERLQAALAKECKGSAKPLRVVLDERGQRLATEQLAQRLQAWRERGGDVALFMGGPDGLHEGIKASADESFRLSDLTLPHALARVLLAEGLYRAITVLQGHPYHRE